jgi:DNA-binding XRE family transcriptional regulator
MNPTTKPIRSAEQRAEEEAIRRQHAANPIRTVPATTIDQASFASILRLVAKFKSVREQQNLTVTEVATKMGIDDMTLANLESGKNLNPSLATLCKWAEALGNRLNIELTAE